MQSGLLNIALGFFEGFALIVSPCILPILPIFLAGSLTGNKRRPVGIIIGFVLIFSLFTFFSRTLVQYLNIDFDLIRYFSYTMLILFGVIMLSTYLTDKFAEITHRLTTIGSNLSVANNPEGGLFSGFLFGSLIAFIWTPCAGPILAAVIVQTVIQESNFLGFCTIVAFGLGAGIPMLAIALFGRKLAVKLGYFKSHANMIRKILGVIILLSVAFMIYSSEAINTVTADQSNAKNVSSLQDGLSRPYPAPDIAGIESWINSDPLKIKNLKGKVILIDFWAYSCINCVRTFPYLKDWYNKYKDKGLIIIGVHSPEFAFEKNLMNVKNAVLKNELHYPIALDNQFVTWRNYSNQYWPAHYLIDKNGQVVYTHFGEGNYDITENNIRYLLGLDYMKTTHIDVEQAYQQSPETYLGYARAENFSSPEAMAANKENQYSLPKNLQTNEWALQGKWTIMSDKIVSSDANAAIVMNFYAKKVYIVMGSSTQSPINVQLLLNGKKIITEHGKDVIDSQIKVDAHSLYSAVLLNKAGNNILKIIATSPGLEVYTFTFGD